MPTFSELEIYGNQVVAADFGKKLGVTISYHVEGPEGLRGKWILHCSQ